MQQYIVYYLFASPLGQGEVDYWLKRKGVSCVFCFSREREIIDEDKSHVKKQHMLCSTYNQNLTMHFQFIHSFYVKNSHSFTLQSPAVSSASVIMIFSLNHLTIIVSSTQTWSSHMVTGHWASPVIFQSCSLSSHVESTADVTWFLYE